MKALFTRYGRTVVSILLLLISSIFVDFNTETLGAFLESVVTDGEFLVGGFLAVIVHYWGRVKVTVFDPTASIRKWGRVIVAITLMIIQALVASFQADTLADFLYAFVEHGEFTIGAFATLLTHYFGQEKVEVFEPDPEPHLEPTTST